MVRNQKHALAVDVDKIAELFILEVLSNVHSTNNQNPYNNYDQQDNNPKSTIVTIPRVKTFSEKWILLSTHMIWKRRIIRSR